MILTSCLGLDIMVPDFTHLVFMALDSMEIPTTIEDSTEIMVMDLVLTPLSMGDLDGIILTIVIILDNRTSDKMWLTLLEEEENQAIIATERMQLETLLV